MSKIEALKGDYESLEKKRKGERKSFGQSKEDCVKEIIAFRKEIDAFLDDLEKTMLKKLESCENEGQKHISLHISTLTATLRMLESDNKLIEQATNDGSTAVMFAADVQVSKGLQNYYDTLSDIVNDAIDTGIKFEKNTTLASLQTEIDSLGSLIRSIEKSRKILLDSKIQSQKQVNVKLSDDRSPPWITGSVVMSAGEVVLCDRNNGKLKLLDSSDALKHSLKFKDNPWDISVVDAKTVIVTLPWKQQLQYIEVFPLLVSGRVLQLDENCWGVHVTGDKIFTSCHNASEQGDVRILDLVGNLLQQLGINQDGTIPFTTPYNITVCPSEKIFVSDTKKELLPV